MRFWRLAWPIGGMVWLSVVAAQSTPGAARAFGLDVATRSISHTIAREVGRPAARNVAAMDAADGPGVVRRPADGPAALGRPADGQPILSAVVTVEGPSVADVWRTRVAGWKRSPIGRDARTVRDSAESMAATLSAAEAEVKRRQAPVVAAAARLGAKVVGRYVTAANGLLVHGTAAQLLALAYAPGVVAIEPAPRATVHLSNSVPHIGADALAAAKGYNGEGTFIAIVDTGVDYTHADFGGPGTSDAYNTAMGAQDTISDTYQGKALFPNPKVVGGWDFVGANYTSPSQCSAVDEQAALCTTTPHPDPDPLDFHGHGTHVSGIAAGLGTGAVYHGVAPAASLIALKIYGPPVRSGDTDETADGVVDAIEWCTRVNLGQPVPGTAPKRVDVMNMSLGEDFAQGSRLFDTAVDAAAAAGIVLVSSAGNSGDRPYVLGAPSASPHILSVASAAPSTGPNGIVDVISSFSSRGPSKNGALKPDITAPGANIFSALRASGSAGTNLSGTSMSSPHIAGSVALMVSRSHAEELSLAALDLAALLMNYAHSEVYDSPGIFDPPTSIARMGAGRVDVLRAGTGKIMVRAGDIASVNLGASARTSAAPTREEVKLTVRNLTRANVYVLPSSRFFNPDDVDKGLAVDVPKEPILLPGLAEIEVSIGFQWNPAALRDWTVRGSTAIGSPVLTTLALEGQLAVTLVTAAGQPVPGELVATVPFYALPRRASSVQPLQVTWPAGTGDGRISFANRSFPGSAELFWLPKGAQDEDPDEAAVLHEMDLRRVGVRIEPGADGSEPQLAFGVALHAVATVGQSTSTEAHLDTNRDGQADYRVRVASDAFLNGQPAGGSDGLSVGVAAWDAGSGAWAPEQRYGQQPLDLNTRLLFFRAPLAAVGLSPTSPFDFWIVRRGVTEDWWNALQLDVAPDGADVPSGPRFQVDPARMVSPERWSVAVPGRSGGVDGEASVVLHGPAQAGDARPVGGLLALYPDNDFEPADAQLAVAWPATEPVPIYLPYASKQHELVPPGPDQQLREGLLKARQFGKLRMTFDLTDAQNASQNYQAEYVFDGNDRMHVVTSDRASGARTWYWRVFRRGYRKDLPNGTWRCNPINELMATWPEMLDRMGKGLPSYGWQADGEGSYAGLAVLKLKLGGNDDQAAYTARIAKTSGALVSLSRREGTFLNPRRIQVFNLRDFEDPGIGLRPPINNPTCENL